MTLARAHARRLRFADVQRYWDEWAAHYDESLADAGSGTLAYSPAEIRAWELMLRRIVGPPPAQVLDVCTGTGAVALLLALIGYDVTAVDASPRMVDMARAKAERAQLDLRLEEAIAADLPFEDRSFDAATCRLAFGSLLDPESCAREWRRCVRPGGHVLVFDRLHGNRLGSLDRARRTLGLAREHLRGRPKGYLEDVEQAAQLPLWHAAPGAYRNALLRAGLAPVFVEELAGIALLERRRMLLRARLWPYRRLYLVDGVVP